jgi:hypothetical protein
MGGKTHVYHSKLWEDKTKDFFYEICNWVVVSMHSIIYGFPPPRISNKIVANIGKTTNWYIEEHFSYIGFLVVQFLHMLYLNFY